MMCLWFLHLFVVTTLEKYSKAYVLIRDSGDDFIQEDSKDAAKRAMKTMMPSREEKKEPMSPDEIRSSAKKAMVEQAAIMKSKDPDFAEIISKVVKDHKESGGRMSKRMMYKMLLEHVKDIHFERAFRAFQAAIKRIKAENVRAVRGRVSVNYVRAIFHTFIFFYYFKSFIRILFFNFSPLQEVDLHMAREILSVAIGLVSFDIFHKEIVNWSFILDRFAYILMLGIAVSYTDEPLHAVLVVFFRSLCFPVDFFLALKGYIPQSDYTRTALAVAGPLYAFAFIGSGIFHIFIYLAKFQYYNVFRLAMPVFSLIMGFYDISLADYLFYQLKKYRFIPGMKAIPKKGGLRELIGPLYDVVDKFEPDYDQVYDFAPNSKVKTE
jgi:hypothetical protein